LTWVRAAAPVAAAALSFACVRDSFSQPFSKASPFVPWVADAWRSAYPWACAAAGVAAIAAHRAGRGSTAGDYSLTGLAALAFFRFAGAALYAAGSRLLPAGARDEILIPLVFLGLVLETWLPVVVGGMLGLAAIRWVAVRAGGGWPTRGRYRRSGGAGDG
jgi:hypothetical protein